MHVLPSMADAGALRLMALAVVVAVAGAACSSETAASLIASGKQASARKEYTAAIIQYRSALQREPASTEARILLGQALLDSGDPSGAIIELTKALDGRAPTAAVAPSLSKALLLAGEYKKLVDTLGDLTLEDKQARAAVKANVASAWGVLGNKVKTEQAVTAALEAVPDHAPALILTARLAAGRGEFDEATRVVDKALQSAESSAEGWQLRGEIQEFARKDVKAAEAAYLKALAADPGYLQAHTSLINMRLVQRDVAAAKLQADKLRAALPNHPMTVLMDAYLAYASQDFAAARDKIQVLLRVFPDRSNILTLAGAIESGLGSLVQAESHLLKAVQIAPAAFGPRQALAGVHIRLGQYQQALDTLKPLLLPDSRFPVALSLAGDAELRLGNAAAAERYFVQSSKLDPDNTRVRAAAAVSRMVSGDPLPALAELDDLAKASKDTFAEDAIFAARMRRREYDLALAAVDSMARKRPDSAAVAELRGRVHLERNDLVAARKAYEEALRLDPARFGATASVAKIDMLEAKPQDAIARLEGSAKADPRNAYALMAIVEIKASMGAPPDEVKGLLGQAVTRAPGNADARLQQISYLLLKRLYKEALTAANDAAAALPNDPRVLEAVGVAQMQSGDVEQAATTFRRLATATPNSARPYMRLADVYMVTGKRAQAEGAVTKALELEPGLASAQAALVDLLLSSGRQRNAIEFIRRIQASRPNQTSGYELEATYHLRAKDPEAAKAAYRRGLAKTKSTALAASLYKLLIQSKNPAEADQFGAAWLRENPKDPAFEFVMAEGNILRGELVQAEARLRRVLAVAPNDPRVLNNLAWVLLKSGKPGAVALAQRAVDMAPERPDSLDTLALALAADGKVAEGLAVLKRAVAAYSENSTLRLSLAKLALQAGDKALARQELDHLLALGAKVPAREEVERLRKSI